MNKKTIAILVIVVLIAINQSGEKQYKKLGPDPTETVGGFVYDNGVAVKDADVKVTIDTAADGDPEPDVYMGATNILTGDGSGRYMYALQVQWRGNGDVSEGDSITVEAWANNKHGSVSTFTTFTPMLINVNLSEPIEPECTSGSCCDLITQTYKSADVACSGGLCDGKGICEQYGCNQAACGDVVFRQSVLQNQWSSATSNDWVAYDADDDGDLDAFGYDQAIYDSMPCVPDFYTADGHAVNDGGNILYIYTDGICSPSVTSQRRWFRTSITSNSLLTKQALSSYSPGREVYESETPTGPEVIFRTSVANYNWVNVASGDFVAINTTTADGLEYYAYSAKYTYDSYCTGTYPTIGYTPEGFKVVRGSSSTTYVYVCDQTFSNKRIRFSKGTNAVLSVTTPVEPYTSTNREVNGGTNQCSSGACCAGGMYRLSSYSCGTQSCSSMNSDCRTYTDVATYCTGYSPLCPSTNLFCTAFSTYTDDPLGSICTGGKCDGTGQCCAVIYPDFISYAGAWASGSQTFINFITNSNRWITCT